MIVKAVIFDLDGTLIDTLADLAASTNHALRQHSLPTHPTETFNTFIGDGTWQLISRTVPDDRQELIPDVLAAMQDHYAEHYADQTRPYQGVAEMLEDLRTQGLRLAILTNKPTQYAVPLAEKFFPPDTFQVVMGHNDKYPLKPDPTSALAIAAEMGAAPGETAFLGDTSIDMYTARAAKMFAVGALWGFRDRAELVDTGALALLDTPKQFPQLLTLTKFPPGGCGPAG